MDTPPLVNTPANSTHRGNASRQIIRSLKQKADAHRTLAEIVADWMTEKLGSMGFLILNAAWFLIWILFNTELVPGIKAFDPFPFGLLTMVVSLEAIILAIFVLISQNRSEKVDDLRQEIDLQVDMIAEREVTKALQIVVQIAEKNGIDLSHDTILQEMLRPTNTQKIEEILEQQIQVTKKV